MSCSLLGQHLAPPVLLQCVAECCSELQSARTTSCRAFAPVLLQSVAVSCSLLQSIAVLP